MLIIYAVVLVALCAVVYWDWRWRRIPNWLNGIVFLAAAAHAILMGDLMSVYALSFFIGALIWGGLFYIKAIGGGDAKLLMALSALVLPANLLWFYLCVTLCGAVQALYWRYVKKSNDLPYGIAIAAGSLICFLTSGFSLLT